MSHNSVELLRELADLPLLVPGSSTSVFQAVRSIQERARKVVDTAPPAEEVPAELISFDEHALRKVEQRQVFGNVVGSPVVELAEWERDGLCEKIRSLQRALSTTTPSQTEVPAEIWIDAQVAQMLTDPYVGSHVGLIRYVPAPSVSEWAQRAAEKWFMETRTVIEDNRARSGGSFADSQQAAVDFAVKKLASIIESTFGKGEQDAK